MGISALEQIKTRKREEWDDMLQSFIEDPQQSANHLVFGFNKQQRQQATDNSRNSVPNWV